MISSFFRSMAKRLKLSADVLRYNDLSLLSLLCNNLKSRHVLLSFLAGSVLNTVVDDPLVGAISEDINGAKFVVFKVDPPEVIASHREDIKLITVKEGWVEQSPGEILEAIKKCIDNVVEQMTQKGREVRDIVAVGIVGQRDTVLCWSKNSGRTLCNCITSADTRAAGLVSKYKDSQTVDIKVVTGTYPVYSSNALKLRWLMDNVSAVNQAISNESCLCGSVDSWIIWNLTGGKNGGVHATDVTNASKSLLMSIKSCKWDPRLLKFFDVPETILPTIKSSSEFYGCIASGPLKGIPIAGCLKDRHATFVGLQCFKKGMIQGLFDTDIALLLNCGNDRIKSKIGFDTVVAYKFGKREGPVYAIEGFVGVFQEAIDWLRESMHAADDYDEITKAVSEAEKTPEGEVVLVPAFDGLPSLYEKPDAKGTICGITFSTTLEHIVKAALEAVCLQTADILGLMATEAKIPIKSLKVSGPLTSYGALMQYESDITGLKVEKVKLPEAPSIGAGLAAARAVGYWNPNQSEIKLPTYSWLPRISAEQRDIKFQKWKLAIEKSVGWIV